MSKLRSIPLPLWLAGGLALTHLALTPLRDWVSVLSGTPVPGVPFELAALGGLLYVLAYFGAVLVAPILAIAGAVTLALRRLGWDQRRRASSLRCICIQTPATVPATAPARPSEEESARAPGGSQTQAVE